MENDYDDLMPGEFAMGLLRKRCKPLRVGITLLVLMAFAVTLQLSNTPMRTNMLLTVLGTMYAAMWLTVVMLISLCEQNNQSAAWLTVVLSPVVIGLFSVQLEAILAGLFGLGVSQGLVSPNANMNII